MKSILLKSTHSTVLKSTHSTDSPIEERKEPIKDKICRAFQSAIDLGDLLVLDINKFSEHINNLFMDRKEGYIACDLKIFGVPAKLTKRIYEYGYVYNLFIYHENSTTMKEERDEEDLYKYIKFFGYSPSQPTRKFEDLYKYNIWKPYQNEIHNS